MNRRRAIRSSTAVTTYSYWLIQRNYVEGKMLDKGKSVPFPIRDFTICDEAHKIPEIIQNHFSPRIGMDAVTKIEDMYAFLVRKGFPTPRKSPSSMRSLVNKILREDEQEKIFFSLKELELALSEYTKCGNGMKESMTLSSKELLKSKEWRVAFAQVDFIKDLHCKFEDYNHIISQVGLDYMIKNPQDSGNVVFNCLEESYMMNRHFHEQSKFKLLMTATMGDPKDFMAAIGATKCRYQKMDSRFNFDRSPIHFYPQYRMSMNKRDENFNWMKKKVEEILASHPDECGIIHSGSYENAAKIYAQLEQNKRSRIITYTNSQEKTSALIEFADSKNSVLIGPSLLEGLDLFEDKSRFQIFLKVPFPSLGDKFVNAKMNYAPAWYDWKTCIAILQGIGRSVRSKDDWAVTYFLDGCLADLFKRRRSSFPLEFQKRIVINKD
jgi:Rad3-related DNA helicase